MIMNRHKLKFVLAQNDSGVWTDQFDDDGIIVLRSTEQTVDGGWKIEAPARLRFDYRLPEEQFLKRGDIVITKSSGSSLHIGKASLVNDSIEAMHCTFSNFMQRLRCKPNYEPRFVWYYLNSVAGRNELDRASNTTTGLANLNGTLIGNLEISFPSFSTQIRIAAYLDEQTAKIDRLIDKRQQQIELLKEQRAALIQQAVTRGLNPDAPLKDSGIAWLGVVPEHWEIKRNKVLFREIDNRSKDGSEELLTVSHITGITPRAQKEEVNMFLAESNEGYKRVEVGDLAINTMWAWMGALGFSTYQGIVSPSYNVYRMRAKANIDYYNLLFHIPSFTKEIMRHSTGVWESRLRLYPQAFFEIRSPVPPLTEQAEIVDFVERTTGKTEKVTDALSRQIALLQEYRAALIHEGVTGERIANG